MATTHGPARAVSEMVRMHTANMPTCYPSPDLYKRTAREHQNMDGLNGCVSGSQEVVKG